MSATRELDEKHVRAGQRLEQRLAHARLRARGLMNAGELGPNEPNAPWYLDEAARALVRDGEALTLSALEYGALAYLLAQRERVVSRDELLDAVWHQRNTGSNVVDAVVRLLRKKLGPYAACLETVRGHGYRIVNAP